MDLSELPQYLQTLDFTPILPQITQVIKTSIDRNFSEGGRYGDEQFGGGSGKWNPSKRAIKQHGQTLDDSGQLAESINVNVYSENGGIHVEIGSNKPYAAIQQHGGTIQRAAHSRLYTQNRIVKGPRKGQFKKGTKYGQGSEVGAFQIIIEARPYLVLQDEDIQEIQQIVIDHIQSLKT